VKKKILSVLKYLFFLAIGGVLFWLAIRGENIDSILIEIKKADYRWIALAIITMLVSHIIRALRWNQLLEPLNIKVKTHTTFYAVMIGYFVNIAVPRLGEITRCGVLARHHKVPVNSVIGTVIAERAFDVITMLVILIITILSQLSFLEKFIYKNIFEPLSSKFPNSSAALLIITGSFIGICLLIIIVYRLCLPMLRKLKLFHKIIDLIKGFWEGVKTIKNVKNKKLFIFYSILLWGFYTLTIYISFFAVSATSERNFIDALTVMALGSIGTLAPTPGGIGAYQYFVKITLSGLYKISEIPAFSFANIVYFTQWFMIIIVGSISWLILFLSDKKKKEIIT